METGQKPMRTLVAEGRFEEAEALCRSLDASGKAEPSRWDFLGEACLRAGQHARALLCLKRVTEISPGSYLAWARLGSVLYTMGQPVQAVPCYRQAAALSPGNVHVLGNLGLALCACGNHSEGIAVYEEAIRLAPDLPESHCQLGYALTSLGEWERGLMSFQRALALRPGMPEAVGGAATALERNGRREEALEMIRPLVKREPEHAGMVCSFVRLARTQEDQESAALLAERVLKSGTLGTMQRIALESALARLRERQGDYDAAFRHCQAANRLSPRRYNAENDNRFFDDIIAAFSRENMETLPRAEGASGRILFIVGMPRSGTSLTEQILASHPDVKGGGEQAVVVDAVHLLTAETGLAWPRCVSALSVQTAQKIASESLQRYASLASAARFVTDKLPHNFLHLGLIDVLFPQAHVIHCVRDPLDTCLSCYFEQFTTGHDYAYGLESLAAHYRNYARIMHHWKNVLSKPVYELRYEKLVENPEQEVRALLAYCDLPWDERCLDFHNSDRPARTASYEQVRKPIYRDSIGKWRRYEKYLGPLIEGLADVNAGG